MYMLQAAELVACNVRGAHLLQKQVDYLKAYCMRKTIGKRKCLDYLKPHNCQK